MYTFLCMFSTQLSLRCCTCQLSITHIKLGVGWGRRLGMAAHAYNPSPQETDQKFKLILSYAENLKPEKFLLYHVGTQITILCALLYWVLRFCCQGLAQNEDMAYSLWKYFVLTKDAGSYRSQLWCCRRSPRSEFKTFIHSTNGCWETGVK